ncbi:glycosyl hydrolase family 95 catalytic domain-containing protein [Rubritalea marina]|uniref:glycosyl hydrolase family 95 catalytic domain-containing protein n=1 Tax=Rubritalea marina TaxID=361055 RepID=UPI000364C913|nr:hypothetical protein [Rubritalea marina]
MTATRISPIDMSIRALIHCWASIVILASSQLSFSKPAQFNIDWESFLSRHDMTWEMVPKRWEHAPYSGNGNVGFLFYQGKSKNVMSIHTGRHDYYDHRLPEGAKEHLWIYRCRLPLGHFELQSQGDITGVDLRLRLWDAELTGTVSTTRGSYKVRALSHSQLDVIYFETDAVDGESVEITWKPAIPYSSVRKTLDAGRGPKGGSWDNMRKAPYPLAPEPVHSTQQGTHFCLQQLHQQRGETTTGWTIDGSTTGKQQLLASVHHCFPGETNSKQTVESSLNRGRALMLDGDFFSSHRAWWHAYYPQSFLTLKDPEKEAFYWIQMYKLGSAMRENGPILDLMGPWYHDTFWPMVWGDLNVQLQYWTHLTANRMAVGESLPNNLDKYAANLSKNVPKRWKDSAAIAACFPQNCLANNKAKVPDMLAWIMHNYWLHCEYAGDRERMRDGLFPLLKQTVNSYLNYLKDNQVPSADGTVHIKRSWSPEYPGGNGQDVNFTLALLRWSCQTLLNINQEFALDDPLSSEWQHIIDHLVAFQIDDNGLRIGKDIPFDKPHRHYSHLLAFYPLAVLKPDAPEGVDLLTKSLDHWLDTSINGAQKDTAMPVTGYTATGAASMYAMAGKPEKAYHYLDFLIQHRNVSTTTMYAEGNPVIESPLSFATALHDMLLQSWGGCIRVFRGTPKRWTDLAFHNLRTQGAFLVSAKKRDGATQFVSVESLAGSPCTVQTDISNAKIYINGTEAPKSKVKLTAQGCYSIDLNKGETVIFTPVNLADTDLVISPLPMDQSHHHLFGLSDKTKRLPGHQFYQRN